MIVGFEMLDNATSGNAVEVTQDVGHVSRTVGDDMSVVRHDDVGKDQEVAGPPCLVKRTADNFFKGVGSKDGKPVVSYRGQIIGGPCAGDSKHFNEQAA